MAAIKKEDRAPMPPRPVAAPGDGSTVELEGLVVV